MIAEAISKNIVYFDKKFLFHKSSIYEYEYYRGTPAVNEFVGAFSVVGYIYKYC